MVDFVHETAEKSATHFGGATRVAGGSVESVLNMLISMLIQYLES